VRSAAEATAGSARANEMELGGRDCPRMFFQGVQGIDPCSSQFFFEASHPRMVSHRNLGIQVNGNDGERLTF